MVYEHLSEQRVACGVDGSVQLLLRACVGAADLLERNLQRDQLEWLVRQVRVVARGVAVDAACMAKGSRFGAGLFGRCGLQLVALLWTLPAGDSAVRGP